MKLWYALRRAAWKATYGLKVSWLGSATHNASEILFWPLLIEFAAGDCQSLRLYSQQSGKPGRKKERCMRMPSFSLRLYTQVIRKVLKNTVSKTTNFVQLSSSSRGSL